MRAATCLAAVGILVSAASCGTAQPASEGAGPTATNPVSSNSGPWGVEIVEPPRSAGEPSLVEQLAVFHDKRTARDVLESCCPSDESDTVEGRELYGQSRLLAAPNSSLF